MSARRPMPADFAETSRQIVKHKLLAHYGCGATTLERWFAELRGDPIAPHKTVREMPADFAEHAHKTNLFLADRYKCTYRLIARWRAECGIVPAGLQVAVPLPADFADRATTHALPDLIDHYSRSEFVVRRWLRECGLKPLRTAAAKRQPVYRPRGAPIQMPKPVPNDGSRAALAAEFLRRWCPVHRCDAQGHYLADGFFWRHGSQVRTDDELIERATAKGWNPDAWREVRAA